MENNKQQKNTALIRIILCVAVMIILFLGIFKIVSRKITLPVSSVLLIAVAIFTRPLRHISKAVMKVKGDYTELQFESCQYPEINVIAETIMNMSKDVKEYLSQIEKEKQIRQEFFSNASHELKTPITSIQGYAELLESGMIQDDGMKLDFARRIKKEAAGMTGLINDILMISRLESMDAEVMFSDVRISVLLQEIMDRLIGRNK